MRHPQNKRAGQRQFKRTAGRTKAINVNPRNMRGGIRL